MSIFLFEEFTGMLIRNRVCKLIGMIIITPEDAILVLPPSAFSTAFTFHLGLPPFLCKLAVSIQDVRSISKIEPVISDLLNPYDRTCAGRSELLSGQ